MEQRETFSFSLIHAGWYLIVSDMDGDSWKTKASFDNRTQEFALDSSFIVMPYTMDDALKNCGTIGPQEPEEPEKPPSKPEAPEKPPEGPPPSGPPGSKDVLRLTSPTSLSRPREIYRI